VRTQLAQLETTGLALRFRLLAFDLTFIKLVRTFWLLDEHEGFA
jgi:hypothetical protein